MATAITTTPQDITGDFDLVVRATDVGAPATILLERSLGTGSNNFVLVDSVNLNQTVFVKNVGTNSYRLSVAAANTVVEFEQ